MKAKLLKVFLFGLVFAIASGISHGETGTVKGCKNSSKCRNKKCTERSGRKSEAEVERQPETVAEVLEQLGKKLRQLKTYQAQVKYLVIQDPEMLDARTLRMGKMYYAKEDKNSKVRINFETLKQDDGDTEKYRQEFVLDKGWLVKIDYRLEQVDYRQVAPADKAFDAFEFVSRNFPLIGFTKPENLSKEFEIKFCEPKDQDDKGQIGLVLTVRKDSKYHDMYQKVAFWLDKKVFLPIRIRTETKEGDIYDILLLQPITNKKLKNSVFSVETPQHFSKNKTELKSK